MTTTVRMSDSKTADFVSFHFLLFYFSVRHGSHLVIQDLIMSSQKSN